MKKTANKISNISNGTFTLINREKGSHITMKIHTVKGGDLKGKRIISKLIGPDNTTSFQGIAFLNTNDTYALWKKHRTDKNGQIISILLAMLIKGKASRFSEKISIKASTTCLRCNRKLTTPQSIADGIGPECIKKGMQF